MKKYIPILFWVLTIPLICKSQTDENNPYRFKLIGKVKSVKTIPYKGVEKQGVFYKIEILNEDFYFNSSIYHLRYSYILYDKTGRIIEENYYKSNNKLSRREIVKYINNEQLTEITTYNSDSLILIDTLKGKFNKNGNLIEAKKNDKLVSTTEYKYDINGKIKEFTIHWSNNQSQLTKYKYDKNGFVNKTINFYPEGTQYQEFKNDNQGNILELKKYYKKSKIQRDEYRYDKQGNLLDNYGYDIDGSLLFHNSFQYTYDKYNNWTKLTYKCKEFNLDLIVEREIEYFE